LNRSDRPGRPAPLVLRRLRNRILTFLGAPHKTLGWFFFLALGYLIFVPIVVIVLATLQVQERDVRRIGAQIGDWTLFYWERALNSPFSQRVFFEPLLNTIVISIGYTVLAMAIGIGLAWLLVKTDIPFKKFIGAAVIVPYILPSWTLALAWITVFRNDQVGVGAPGILQALVGITPPSWLAYGPVPIMLVLAFNYFAFTFLLAAAAMTTMDTSLEESALLHGASGSALMRWITLPMILPALGSAFILTFAQGLGSFGVPAFLGMPVNYYVLATSLFGSVNVGRFGDAFVMTIVLIAIAGLTIYANGFVLGKRRQFTTMTGKGAAQRLVRLGRWRTPITSGVLFFLFCVCVVPVALLLLQSLQLRLGQFSIENFTLTYWTGYIDGYHGILVDPRVRNAGFNSLLLGVIVGVGTAFVGVLIGYVIVKGRGSRLSRLVEQLSFLPYLIPGIAFGAIYLTMWAQPRGPLPALYGTFALLVLAGLVSRIPFATRTGTSAMMQIGPSLEEAGQLHGAGFLSRLRWILLPLSSRGFLAGFVLSFIAMIKDLSLVVLLVTPRTMLLPVLTLGYTELGRRQFADAIAVVIVIVVLGGTWLAKLITRTDPIQGFGGGTT
jgi:iron(III) transport system permease protein